MDAVIPSLRISCVTSTKFYQRKHLLHKREVKRLDTIKWLINNPKTYFEKSSCTGNGCCGRRKLRWLVIQQQRLHWWASFSTAQAWLLQQPLAERWFHRLPVPEFDLLEFDLPKFDLPGVFLIYTEVFDLVRGLLTCPDVFWPLAEFDLPEFLTYPKVVDLPGCFLTYPDVLDLPLAEFDLPGGFFGPNGFFLPTRFFYLPLAKFDLLRGFMTYPEVF